LRQPAVITVQTKTHKCAEKDGVSAKQTYCSDKKSGGRMQPEAQ
jgi:hypothetical protein